MDCIILISRFSLCFVDGAPGAGVFGAMGSSAVAFGVPAEHILLESHALNTIENIRNVKALVGSEHVALVTSGFHMPRAMRIARQAKLDAAAFPTAWQVVPEGQVNWQRYLPSVDALVRSTIALKEYLALAFDYRKV